MCTCMHMCLFACTYACTYVYMYTHGDIDIDIDIMYMQVPVCRDLSVCTMLVFARLSVKGGQPSCHCAHLPTSACLSLHCFYVHMCKQRCIHKGRATRATQRCQRNVRSGPQDESNMKHVLFSMSWRSGSCG